MIHILPLSANIQINGGLGPDKLVHAHAQHAWHDSLICLTWIYSFILKYNKKKQQV